MREPLAKKEHALDKPQFLRRYTALPALIYLLQQKKLTLVDPQYWDDRNDSYYIDLYKQKKRLKSVLALCFAEAEETYHHWRVFAPGSGGVCIQFRKTALLGMLKKRGLRAEPVRYLSIAQSRQTSLEIAELPFLKRIPYGHEKEFRLLYQSSTRELSHQDFDIALDCIDRVVLSPWLHANLVDDIKRLLKNISGCDKLKIHRSTLISNDDWKKLGDAAVQRRS